MANRILLNSLKWTKDTACLSSFVPVRVSSNGFSTSLVRSEEVTHTGQKFEEGDYRLSRFVDKKKHVNKQFAIKLIDEEAPAPRKERVVWCDGGGGPTGHPKVYINLDKPGNHACGYCGLRFFKEPKHH